MNQSALLHNERSPDNQAKYLILSDPGTSDPNSLIRMCFRAAKNNVAPHGILRLSSSSPRGNYRCKYA